MFSTLREKRFKNFVTPAMESIDFQTDNFGSQLEAIFYNIEDFIQSKRSNSIEYLRLLVNNSEFPKILSDTIFKRLGIKVKVKFNTTSSGCIMPFFINENHVLLKKMWRGEISRSLSDQRKLLKTLNSKNGTIDLKNAVVSGIFSEYEHDLWIDVVGHLLNEKSTIPEIVAILLHELGHAFTYYEYANRLEETNQVLASLSDELRGQNNVEKKKVIFKEISKNLGLKENTLDELAEEKNQTILGLKLFKEFVGSVRSQLPNGKYNETASEQLADNFAARFGYGRHLVTALQRLYKNANIDHDDAYVRKSYFLEIIFVHLQALISLICLFLGIVTITTFYSIALWVILFVVSKEDSLDMTYDQLKIRYKRVRQQYIEMINKLYLDKDKLRQVVDDVHFLDEIVQKTAIHRTLMTRLSNFVFSSGQRARDDIELQYLLEDLTHSDLFLKSAELSTLA